jgi:hypothetical protein
VFGTAGTTGDVAAHQISDTFVPNKPPITLISGTRFMRLIRIGKVFSALVLAGSLSAPALAQQPFDGTWNVTIVTKSGSCDPTASSTLTVTEGKISAAGANVSGSIGREGLVRVSINGAYANGQLSGNAGSGKWNGASGGIPCSGRWEASRQ